MKSRQRSILLGCILFCSHPTVAAPLSTEPEFAIERTVMVSGYDGNTCWVHARTGIIPTSTGHSFPVAVLTTQKLMLTGSDVFYALNSSESTDLGNTWSPLVEQTSFRRTTISDRVEETICDFTPAYHRATGSLLGIGQTVRYENNRVMRVRPRSTGYSVYDQVSRTWSAPKLLQMPAEPCYANCGAGSVQRLDLEDGTILLPVYFKQPDREQYSVTVCRCEFDGNELTFREAGSQLTIDVKRGLYEPSLTTSDGRYFLTLRNDDHGYVAVSDDGLHFEQPKRWTFNDGSDLGNYNTQQHWVTHNQQLYLVYTRRGANNDHVFRHRAPLFIARVDPTSLQVIRSTERELVPERGARLGNFGVVNVSPTETWVTVAEWMQKNGPDIVIPMDNERGADNSIHIVKIKWTTPDPAVR